MKHRATFLNFVTVLAVGVPYAPVYAAEICVTCQEPSAIYRCAIDGEAAGAPADPSIQLYCIKELASRGGHKSCSVSRAQAGTACDGQQISLGRPASSPPAAAAAAPPSGPPPPGDTTSQPAPVTHAPPEPTGPPQTVEALAKDAAAQTQKDWEKTTSAAGQTLEKAGNTVGGAVKKSWDCLSSLFARC